jgi:hypothetical protein
MTEEEAREVLRADDRDGLEAWIAGQPWIVMPGGWWKVKDEGGGHFHLLPLPEGIRIIAHPAGSKATTTWIVMA